MKRAWYLMIALALLMTSLVGQALGEVSCPHHWVDRLGEIEIIWENAGVSHNEIQLLPKKCTLCGVETVLPYSTVKGHEMKMESWEHLTETEEDIYHFVCIRCGFRDERVVPCEGKEDECGMMYRDVFGEEVQHELLQQTTSHEEVALCPHEWEDRPGSMELLWRDKGITHEMMLLSPVRCVLCGAEAYEVCKIEEEHTHVRMCMDFVENDQIVSWFICTKCGNLDIQAVPGKEAAH